MSKLQSLIPWGGNGGMRKGMLPHLFGNAQPWGCTSSRSSWWFCQLAHVFPRAKWLTPDRNASIGMQACKHVRKQSRN